MKDLVKISHLTKFHAFRANRNHVIDLETWFKIHTNVSKAPAKRSQHANSTYRNIVGRNMLRAFGHPVAICCDVLGVVGPNLTIFKLEPTTPNMSQHIATGWPNARNMMRPTMLRYVALTCCDRLAGA